MEKSTLEQYLSWSKLMRSEMDNYIRKVLPNMFGELKLLYPEIHELHATAHFNEGTAPFIRIFYKTEYFGRNIEIPYVEENMNIKILAELMEPLSYYKNRK